MSIGLVRLNAATYKVLAVRALRTLPANQRRGELTVYKLRLQSELPDPIDCELARGSKRRPPAIGEHLVGYLDRDPEHGHQFRTFDPSRYVDPGKQRAENTRSAIHAAVRTIEALLVSGALPAKPLRERENATAEVDFWIDHYMQKIPEPV